MENKVSVADFSKSYTLQQNIKTNLLIKIYPQHQYQHGEYKYLKQLLRMCYFSGYVIDTIISQM